MALRLAARPSSLYCGKLLYNLTLMLALEALVAPLYVILLQMPVVSTWDFIGILLIGGYGLTAAGTLTAAMVAQARIHGALFAVLSFPIMLPLLIFAVQLTRAAVTGEAAPVALHQAFLYDATLTIVGLMLFPAIWNP
jgi:heme exporter protein B